MDTRKISIAYVFPGRVNQVGGAETQALHFFQAFDRKRFEVSLLLIGDNPEFRERVQRIGDIPVRVFGGRLLEPWSRYRAQIAEAKYDIVHLYGLRVEVLARPITSVFGQARVVSAIRSVEAHRGRLHVAANRFTSQWVDLWISNSEQARTVFISRDKVPPDKIKVIRSGIPCPYDDTELVRQREVSRARLSAQSTEFLVALIGNHSQRKRQEDLVEAAAICAGSGLKPRLYFIGKRSDYSARFEALARMRGVDHLVCMSGPSSEVQQLLPAMDAFVLPSLDEGVPAAALEAMMAGVPVIATAVGGTPEAIESGRTGFLVPVRRPDLIAETLLQLYKSPSLRWQVGSAGRNAVREGFSVGALVRHLQDAYEALAA